MSSVTFRTYSGRKFDFIDPEPDQINITDIIKGLSKAPRYSGQTDETYSVAQHSVYTSLYCDPKDALWGLLHDASEGYTGDMNGQLKRQLPFFKLIEDKIMGVIAEVFGLEGEEPESVRKVDRMLLFIEHTTFWPKDKDYESSLKVPLTPALENDLPTLREEIGKPWSAGLAEASFWRRFHQLTKGYQAV